MAHAQSRGNHAEQEGDACGGQKFEKRDQGTSRGERGNSMYNVFRQRHMTHADTQSPTGPMVGALPERQATGRNTGSPRRQLTHWCLPVVPSMWCNSPFAHPCVVYSVGILWILVGLVVQPDKQRILHVHVGLLGNTY